MPTKTTKKAPAKKTKDAAQGAGFQFFGVRLLEKIVDWLRGFMTEGVLEFCIKWATKIGHWALIAAAGIGFLFCIIFAIRANDFFAFLIGIGWVILVFVVQYTAVRFAPAGDKLINNNPTRLASRAFLDCVAFLALLGGLVMFIMGAVNAIRGAGLETFLMGLGILIITWFVALVAFNPQTASMEIVDEASAGQEAIGIITFFLKKILRLVPIAFGVGIVVFTIMLFIHMFKLFGSQYGFAMKIGMMDANQILTFALLPFLTYILFVLYFLVIDVIRAILSVPEKLDNLKK